MNKKIKRLLKWAKGGQASPFTLDINPTDKCNLKCIHCWQRASEPDSKHELSDEKLINLTKEAIKFGIEEFEITGGGEPMMRKDLVLQIMKIIKDNEKFGNITTNGVLFDLEDIKKLIKMDWDRVTFSIDGPNPKINDYLRGKGTFKAIMNTITKFNKLKKEKKKPLIKFNTVIHRKNYDKVHEMIELAEKVGCSIIHFDSLTIHSENGKKLKLSEDQRREFKIYAKKAKKLAKKYKIQTDADQLNEEFLEKSNKMTEIIEKDIDDPKNLLVACYEPWWHLVIKTDGSAQPCCLYDSKKENIKDKSLKDIWFGEYFTQIRKNILKGKLSDFCSICNAGQVLDNIKIRKKLYNILKTKNEQKN